MKIKYMFILMTVLMLITLTGCKNTAEGNLIHRVGEEGVVDETVGQEDTVVDDIQVVEDTPVVEDIPEDIVEEIVDEKEDIIIDDITDEQEDIVEIIEKNKVEYNKITNGSLDDANKLIREIYRPKMAYQTMGLEAGNIELVTDELIIYNANKGIIGDINAVIKMYDASILELESTVGNVLKEDIIHSRIIPELLTIVQESINLELKSAELDKLNKLRLLSYHTRYVAYRVIEINMGNAEVLDTADAFIEVADRLLEEYNECYSELMGEYGSW